MNQQEIFKQSVRHVANLCAAAAMSVSHKNIFFDKQRPEVKFPA